jgi:hypothetical protein
VSVLSCCLYIAVYIATHIYIPITIHPCISYHFLSALAALHKQHCFCLCVLLSGVSLWRGCQYASLEACTVQPGSGRRDKT